MCNIFLLYRLQLDPFGLPYSRYFKFLKFAFWICVAAMLASVPNMALFHEGGTYTEAAAVHMEPYIAFEHGRYHDTSGLHARPVQAATYIDVKRAAERITLGNLLLLPDNVTTFDAFNSIGLHVPLSRNLFGLFVTGDVVLVGIVLLAGVTWFWRNTLANNARETWNPHGTVTIEEYSVSVSGLPRFTTKEELKAHLEGVSPRVYFLCHPCYRVYNHLL